MTQDAASRAAEKTLRLCEQRWGRAAPDSEPVLREEAAALVRAEYAELVKACQTMSAHYSGSLDHQPAYVALVRNALKAVEGV